MDPIKPNELDPDEVIDGLGGTVATAALCDVLPSAVSQWRTKGIPKARLMFIRAVRPDVFKVDAAA